VNNVERVVLVPSGVTI
jgi:hypothetical protein